ncbi:MAG: hypothetical protein QOJ50_2887 [Cryptosporangiaceae bacterium]|nr:hypothetical protein [Cryptosporangiaceae bacterium]
MPLSPAHTELARRIRRLLWAYPPSFRRGRGRELVTTLLDGAPGDQRRPTRTQAADLLRNGLACWVRVRGAGTIAAALAAAVTGAVALGGFGGYLGWQGARPLPSNTQALRIAEPVLHTGSPVTLHRWDFLFDDRPGMTDPRWAYWIGGTDTYESGQVFADLPEASLPVGQARRALAAAGWHTDDVTPGSVLGHRNGWTIEVASTFPLGEDQAVRRISVRPDRPAAVAPLTTAGLLVGELAVWLLAAWTQRRWALAGPIRQGLVAVGTLGGICALLPATILSAAAITAGFQHPHEAIPGWAGYAYVFARALAWLGAAALLTAALALATLRSGPTFRTARWTTYGGAGRS